MKSSRGQFQMSASSGKVRAGATPYPASAVMCLPCIRVIPCLRFLQERGFVAHLSPYRSGGFGVTWLQQLGDERVRREGEGSNELVDRSPKITNIFNTKECMAVVAGGPRPCCTTRHRRQPPGPHRNLHKPLPDCRQLSARVTLAQMLGLLQLRCSTTPSCPRSPCWD